MANLNLIDRRRLLHAMACGACGVSVSGWLPALAQADCDRSAAAAALHPAVDGGRAEPDGHVRHEAGPRERRRVQGNRHQRAGRAVQRASAEAGPACRQAGDHSQPEHEGRRPRARLVPDANRPAADGRGQLSVGRGGAGQGAGASRTTACRRTSALRRIAAFGQRGFGPGFLGPKFAPLVVGGEQHAAPGRRWPAAQGLPS